MGDSMNDYEPDDSAYAEYVANAAKTCRCCNVCWSNPCAACLAGGICDDMVCHCDDSEREDFCDDDD